MNTLGRFLPWIIVGGVGIMLIVMMSPMERPSNAMNFDEAGQITILHGGRPKPLDTLARVSLMSISGRQTYRDKDDKERPAVQWLLNVMTSAFMRSEASAKVKAFRIEDPQALELLELKERPGGLFAYEEFAPNVSKFIEFVRGRVQAPGNQLAPEDQRLLDLGIQIDAYEKHAPFETRDRVFRIDNLDLLALLNLERREGNRYGFDEFLPRIGPLIREKDRALEVNEKVRTVYDASVLELARRVETHMGLALMQADTLRVIPPMGPNEEWRAMGAAIQDARAGDKSEALQGFAQIISTYSKNDVDGFNKSVASYRKLEDQLLPSETAMARFEAFYNHFAPFYQCMLLYVLMFVLACVSWVLWEQPLARSAFWLGVLILAVHTLSLIARMWIQGRPPVTNLYSSAVFVGWVCVVLGLIVEFIFPYGIASAAAAVLGFATALLAHHLALGGDTMEMMQAVLDTNFWLATHVTAVTIGYASTMIAGLLGVIFIGRLGASLALRYLQGSADTWGTVLAFTVGIIAMVLGLPVIGIPLACLLAVAGIMRLTGDPTNFETALVPTFQKIALTDNAVRVLTQMIYGIICFATLFSFVGTVLGGIWADQSWGRFWGWDPKENGALIIVVWNALILHARWSGMVKQRGVAVLSVVGIMVTMWSWVGTNQLGVGLHAYGFNNTLAVVAVATWFHCLGLMLVGLAPTRFWRVAAAPAVQGGRARLQPV
jgi:ABC-type transport system involved in cytochrome c biogenesis permease subunit